MLEKCIGILVFYTIMILLYRYCTGKVKVKESRRERYDKWSKKYGKVFGNVIIAISALYALGIITELAEIVARG